MTVSVSPATILDLAALSGAISRRQWRIARAMWGDGEFFAIRAAGGRLVAMGYLYPIGDGNAEAGFNFSPVDDADRGLGRAAPHMLGIARAIGLTLRNSAYSAIVTECRTDAGARLARAAGFHPSGLCGNAGEIWAYGPSDRRKLQKAAEAYGYAERPVRSGPAAEPGGDGRRAGGA